MARIDAAEQANARRTANDQIRAMQPQQPQPQVYQQPQQRGVNVASDNHNGVDSLVSAAEGAAIGYMIGSALKNHPWFRFSVALLLGYIGIMLMVQDASAWPGMLICLGLAGLLLWWAHKPVRRARGCVGQVRCIPVR